MDVHFIEGTLDEIVGWVVAGGYVGIALTYVADRNVLKPILLEAEEMHRGARCLASAHYSGLLSAATKKKGLAQLRANPCHL
jgi:hypothetical protein